MSLDRFGAAIGAFVICVGLYGGDLSNYRGLSLGMSVTAAAKEAGSRPSEITTLHQRPVAIQEMQWWPRMPLLADPTKSDPVKDGSLCFYNGELYRIVVNYNRYKIEGMTAEDMIAGISTVYGAAARPAVEIPYHSSYAESAKVIARWENADNSYNLVRTGDQSSFALVLYSKKLDGLAQTAIAEALRLEAQEAPQIELEKQKRKDDEERVALESARTANKPNFRP